MLRHQSAPEHTRIQTKAPCLPSLCFALLICQLSITHTTAGPVVLKYLGHYDTQHPEPRNDHLMGVEPVMDHYALIASFRLITLVDINAMAPGGTRDYLSRIEEVDAYNSVARDDGYVYVNLHRAGLMVAFIDPAGPFLTAINEINESTVYYEEMQLSENRLYIAAHADGIRIFDITDPAQPDLIGKLTEGFADAFSMFVEGTTAYVADGAGGLKIVDISNEAMPVITFGETPDTSTGCAQDVLLHEGRIYLASGSAGIAVYDPVDPTTRRVFDTRGVAKQLTIVGDHLAVADTTGIALFDIDEDGSLLLAVEEYAQFGSSGIESPSDVRPRIWHDVAAYGENQLLAANWDYVHHFEVVDPPAGDHPDIAGSTQRVRFAPAGGSTDVSVTNLGSGLLTIDDAIISKPSVTVEPHSATLAPGEIEDFHIEYQGGNPGLILVALESNDPDENPYPIQVLGQTGDVDPMESAPSFVLESWRRDHEQDVYIYDTFDLEAYRGRIVFLSVFADF